MEKYKVTIEEQGKKPEVVECDSFALFAGTVEQEDKVHAQVTKKFTNVYTRIAFYLECKKQCKKFEVEEPLLSFVLQDMEDHGVSMEDFCENE